MSIRSCLHIKTGEILHILNTKQQKYCWDIGKLLVSIRNRNLHSHDCECKLFLVVDQMVVKV